MKWLNGFLWKDIIISIKLNLRKGDNNINNNMFIYIAQYIST